MIVVRVFLNGLIMAAEVAAVLGIAYLGYTHPFLFAAGTAGLVVILGLRLEILRLRHELPFYFEGARPPRLILVPLVGGVEALMKGVLAGLAALFTFAGTDSDRLFWVAVVFAIVTYAGASILRGLSVSFRAEPWRWGFFRLSAPLGLAFSAGITALVGLGLMTSPSVSEIGWRLVWELPERPSISQVSELFFQIKQAFDDFVVMLLSQAMSREWARVAAIVVSVNVLTGFVASVYATVIAAVVRAAEERLP